MIVYMEEKWFSSHDTARMDWSDNTAKCTMSALPSKCNRINTSHARSTNGFVLNSLLGGTFSESDAHYHDDMNDIVFEKWFENT